MQWVSFGAIMFDQRFLVYHRIVILLSILILLLSHRTVWTSWTKALHTPVPNRAVLYLFNRSLFWQGKYGSTDSLCKFQLISSQFGLCLFATLYIIVELFHLDLSWVSQISQTILKIFFLFSWWMSSLFSMCELPHSFFNVSVELSHYDCHKNFLSLLLKVHSSLFPFRSYITLISCGLPHTFVSFS